MEESRGVLRTFKKIAGRYHITLSNAAYSGLPRLIEDTETEGCRPFIFRICCMILASVKETYCILVILKVY